MGYSAVTVQSNDFSLVTVGLIMMLVGAAGTLASATVFRTSRSSELTLRTIDRQVSDLNGGFRSIRQGTRQLTLRVLSSATTRLLRQILPAWEAGDRRRTSVTARSY
jgi:hypothetical protein